jgi:hypothetical protein
MPVAAGVGFAIVRPARESLGMTMKSETDEELLHQGGGTMDLKDHLKTWHGFLSFVKWMVIGNVVLLTLLFFFRTHN